MRRMKTLLVTLIMLIGILGSTLSVYAEINSDTIDYLKNNVTFEDDKVIFNDRGLEKYLTTDSGEGSTTIPGFGTDLFIKDGFDADLDTFVVKRNEAAEVNERLTGITGNLKIGADTETAVTLIQGFFTCYKYSFRICSNPYHNRYDSIQCI